MQFLRPSGCHQAGLAGNGACSTTSEGGPGGPPFFVRGPDHPRKCDAFPSVSGRSLTNGTLHNYPDRYDVRSAVARPVGAEAEMDAVAPASEDEETP